MPRTPKQKQTRTVPGTRRTGFPAPVPEPERPPSATYQVTLVAEGSTPIRFHHASFAFTVDGDLILHDHRPSTSTGTRTGTPAPIWAVYARGSWLSILRVDEYAEKIVDPNDGAEVLDEEPATV